MKQYTTPEQTAKLIELGFKKPSPKWVKDENGDYRVKTNDADYDIGELIEMLPEFSNIYDLTNMHTMKRYWYVGHISTLNVSAEELIDALYNMIVKLKEAEMI